LWLLDIHIHHIHEIYTLQIIMITLTTTILVSDIISNTAK
jgi:hypothetical protein